MYLESVLSGSNVFEIVLSGSNILGKCVICTDIVFFVYIMAGNTGFIQELSLKLDTIKRTDFKGLESMPALKLTMTKHAGISQTLKATMKRNCDYMSCQSCSTIKLQNICQNAQKCALAKCVGTVVNVNNFFCVVGSTVKESMDIVSSNIFSVWIMVVEIIYGILHLSQLGDDADILQFEFLSNIFVTLQCETKDLLAIISAWIPSLTYTIYKSVMIGLNTVDRIFQQASPITTTQSIISPLTQLQNTNTVSAVIEFIFSIVIGIVHMSAVSGKIIICLTNKLMDGSLGYIQFLDNNVGDTITNYCESNWEDEGTDERSIQNDDDHIKKLVRSGAVGSFNTKVTVTNVDISDQMRVGTDDLLQWVVDYPRMTLLLQVTAVFDWLHGLMYGISGIVVLAEKEECKPRPVRMQSVLDCVCGDKEFHIPTKQRNELDTDAAFWCSGILKMVNADGRDTYIYNKFSFHELVQDLHQKGSEYIEKCATVQIPTERKEECSDLKRHIYNSKYSDFLNSNVSPLAVMTRCRENYSLKTWDKGAFALYNPDIQAQLSVSIIGNINNRFDNLPHNVKTCLFSGPLKNTIQACMFLYLNHHNVDIWDNFKYISTEEEAYCPSPQCVFPDACKLYSSDKFADYLEVKQCQNPHTSVSTCDIGGNMDHHTNCNIMMTTLSIDQHSRVDVINQFKTETRTDITEMDLFMTKTYNSISDCTIKMIDQFDDDIDKTLDNIALDIVSSEGDNLHQMVDCLFMGAYKKTHIMPADTMETLESLIYSRHVTGDSRELPLPCFGVDVLDTHNDNEMRFQRTCGSAARISGMASVLDIFRNDEKHSINVYIKHAMRELLNRTRADFANTSKFGCAGQGTWQSCCVKYGECLPGTNFNADFEISMIIPAEKINEIITLNLSKVVQYRSLTNTSVRYVFYYVSTKWIYREFLRKFSGIVTCRDISLS